MAGTTTTEMQQVIDDVLAAESDADGLSTTGSSQARTSSGRSTSGRRALRSTARTSTPPPRATRGWRQRGRLAAGAFVSMSRLDGVPLFFARGVKPRPQTFSVEPHFRDVLTETVRTVRFRAPASFGDLRRITSAGVLVDKPGFHGKGRAFDHDAWAFEHVNIRPIDHDHNAPSLARRQRYWALAALIRSHSAFVLHGEYNADHRDHIHQDNGGARPFTTASEATVKLVQAICNHIFDHSPKLTIDGDFGSSSRTAASGAMHKVDLAGDIFDFGQWTRFLLRSGRLGFELSMR